MRDARTPQILRIGQGQAGFVYAFMGNAKSAFSRHQTFPDKSITRPISRRGARPGERNVVWVNYPPLDLAAARSYIFELRQVVNTMTHFRNFFISYNNADELWAEWIANVLADAGYTHYFQKWDFRPGGNFVLDMQKAAETSERTLLVLTPSYLQSLYTQPEWAAAFARDPTGEKRLIVPVRVKACEPAGMLKSIVYCDLVGLDPINARATLIAALQPSGKIDNPHAALDSVAFARVVSPNKRDERLQRSNSDLDKGLAPDPVCAAAKELQSILITSGITFQAQANLRDVLCARIEARLRVTKHHEYEELFDLYFTKLNTAELRLHRIIRVYTESILNDYNTRALKLLEREPALGNVLPSVPALKQHLIIWLQKFNSVFLKTPSMCLLYVGVEEDVQFPSQIKEELELFISTSSAKPVQQMSLEDLVDQMSRSIYPGLRNNEEPKKRKKKT